jgi:hypothetical protein
MREKIAQQIWKWYIDRAYPGESRTWDGLPNWIKDDYLNLADQILDIFRGWLREKSNLGTALEFLDERRRDDRRT